MSGSIGVDYCDENLMVSYDNMQHRSYKSSEQVKNISLGLRKEIFSSMNIKRKTIGTTIENFNNKIGGKEAIGRVKASLPVVSIKSLNEYKYIHPNSFPLMLKYTFEHDGRYDFKITLNRKVSDKEISEILTKIEAILKKEEELSDVDFSKYKVPHAEILNDKYGVYFGVNFSVHPEAFKYFVDELNQRANEFDQILSKEINSSNFEKEMKTVLLDVKIASKSSNREGIDLFNPWGPGNDEYKGGHFIRPKFISGNTNVVVLFATKENKWGQLWSEFPKFIEKNLKYNKQQFQSAALDQLIIELKTSKDANATIWKMKEMKSERVADELSTYFMNEQYTPSDGILLIESILEKNSSKLSIEKVRSFIKTLKRNGDIRNVFDELGKAHNKEFVDLALEFYMGYPLGDSGDTFSTRTAPLYMVEESGEIGARGIIEVLSSNKDKIEPARKEELVKWLKGIKLDVPDTDPLMLQIKNL